MKEKQYKEPAPQLRKNEEDIGGGNVIVKEPMQQAPMPEAKDIPPIPEPEITPDDEKEIVKAFSKKGKKKK